MSQRVIILGANGRFGRAAANAFHQAGWHVTAFVRPGRAGRISRDYVIAEGDAAQPADLIAASRGHDVFVNALNPPYPQWSEALPRLTASVIAAAKAGGASVMIPGNIYNYGAGMPKVLRETTPHLPTTRKGELRAEMEETYASAAEAGVQTIILRAGDFFERENTGNWFDSYITPKAMKGKLVYPGPLNCTHSWAYLPDLARAMVGLAESRNQFDPFESFGFTGYAITGREFVTAIEKVVGRSMKVGKVAWPIVRMISLFSPQIREVLEMKYLWETPHQIDGRKLAAALPSYSGTPLEAALKEALGLASSEQAPARPDYPIHASASP